MGLYSKYIFPRLLDWSLGSDSFNRLRKTALASAAGSVLEVGFGTGLNLPNYPGTVTRLTGLDAERLLPKRVAARMASSNLAIEWVQLDASSRLPFPDSEFDSVVTTFTLCSIREVRSALAEMRRVLKPGGNYLFLEHGLSDDPRVARRQDLFNPLQRIIAAGCNLNRPIDELIRGAGFDIVKVDRFIIPDAPRIAGEMYLGIATREGIGGSGS